MILPTPSDKSVGVFGRFVCRTLFSTCLRSAMCSGKNQRLSLARYLSTFYAIAQ